MEQHKRKQSAAELGEKLRGFMDYCTETDTMPTDYQLCNYLEISMDTLERYAKASDPRQDYAGELKKLVAFRENWFLQQALQNPKVTTISIFALKQAKNGGYVDKPSVNVEAKELKIITDGVGEGAFD